MIEGTASRHMYSMASWSPSQSDPFTVSYMCQRQSSSPMLPSAALMPPCAALRRHRVAAGGEHLGDARGLQAFFRHAEGGPQAGSAGAHDDDVVGVVDNLISVRHRCLSLRMQ